MACPGTSHRPTARHPCCVDTGTVFTGYSFNCISFAFPDSHMPACSFCKTQRTQSIHTLPESLFHAVYDSSFPFLFGPRIASWRVPELRTDQMHAILAAYTLVQFLQVTPSSAFPDSPTQSFSPKFCTLPLLIPDSSSGRTQDGHWPLARRHTTADPAHQRTPLRSLMHSQ